MVIEHTFEENGYPIRFIKRAMQSVKDEPQILTAEKKRIYISLPFKGDTIRELISRRIQRAVESTYYAAKLNTIFRTSKAIRSHLKDH